MHSCNCYFFFILQFDELSHKSSGSSLNLAGGSSQASGQGSLENLGGGELLRHNSMKRSGSSASTLPNRAIQSSSSRRVILTDRPSVNSVQPIHSLIPFVLFTQFELDDHR